LALSNEDILYNIKRGRLVITPFNQKLVKGNGLDLRIGNTIARLISSHSEYRVFDSKKEDLNKWYQIEEVDESFIIHPNEHILCHTLEYLKLPNDIIGFCEIRSTFARMSLSIPPTVVDAGFEGQLTIELIGGNFPIKLYYGEKIIHIIFHKLLTPSSSPYSGKYQKQKGLTLPKLKEN
jgi:dCTP deaminase